MTQRTRVAHVPYSAKFSPPAPVLPVGIGGIGPGAPTAMVHMLVDTGADCTMIPTHVAEALALPLVDRVDVHGVGGTAHAHVYAAHVRIAGLREVVRLVALGDEALLGRDLLNRLTVELDGPGETIAVDARADKPSRA
jgi:predicted aspartyl protease